MWYETESSMCILHTVYSLGHSRPYILISYGESPHEIEAANQYWPINE